MNKSSLQVTCNTSVTHKIQRKGGDVMKHDIHTISIFKLKDVELLKQAVTAKVEKLVNEQVKKTS